MSIFNVAISGLNAAQVGILTTSHNIANASTEGYNRQQAVQTTNTPIFTGVGFLGQGTNIETIRRIYSQQLDGQVLAANTGAAEMDSYLAQIGQIDNLLADPDAGLAPALTGFFQAVQQMAADPASLLGRQAMLAASETLVERFHTIDARLDEVRSGVNAQIGNEVAAINSYATQIAALNQRIILAQSSGPQQPANDLLDQRDRLVAELSAKIRVTTLTQNDGTYSVFVGNGQPLVVGTQPYAMQAQNAPDDPERVVVALRSPNGSTVRLPEALLTGGSLGGLLAFRNDALGEAHNALGRIALTLATDFNAQHRQGQDLTNALGGDYFVPASSLVRQPVANGNNTGTAVFGLTIDAVGSLTTSDYRLGYDGVNYTLTRLSDNSVQPYVPGSVVDGFRLDLTGGTPAAGDSFLVQPTRLGAANLALALTDPRAIAAAAPIRTAAALANTGTASISAGEVRDASDPNLWATTTLDFVAGGYRVNGAGPVIPYTSGAPIDLNGWRVTITGTPAIGDSFTIERNLNGVGDNRNANLLAALQTAKTLQGGTAGYQTAYAQIVSTIGSKAHEAEVTGQAQRSLLEQAKAAREQLSGVNLDEEAANLLRYQQAYQAAAKVISIANTLFDEILALGR